MTIVPFLHTLSPSPTHSKVIIASCATLFSAHTKSTLEELEAVKHVPEPGLVLEFPPDEVPDPDELEPLPDELEPLPDELD